VNHEQPPAGEQPPEPIDQEAAASPVEPQPSEPEHHEQAVPPPRIWVGSLSDYNNDSLEAYAEELIQEMGYDDLLDRVVPPSLRPYVDINVAGFAQDMWMNGDVQVYHRSGGGVWLFNGA
jgi:hypothetical protein